MTNYLAWYVQNIFSRNVVNTLRIKIQDNQGIVQFVNHQDEIVHLRKEKAVGILDLICGIF